MPSFSAESGQNLATCHEDLIRLFEFVVQFFDCSVIEGQRNIQRQHELYADGLSWTMKSKHLRTPSHAADVVPYPVDWEDEERMVLFAGFVQGAAAMMGIDILWGGDWDHDYELGDEDKKKRDYAHFELKE